MSIRTFTLIAVLGAASVARADEPKGTTCTLDGDPLTYPDKLDHFGRLAVAPNGDVLVLDGANRVRRYRVKSGKGCALAIDRTFGKNGVLDVGIGADRGSVTLAVDADGTIYVSDVPNQPVRVRGGKVEKMCGDATRVNASARSKIIWRYEWATEATRERGDCSDAKSAYLKGWDAGASHLWVVDERAVAFGDLHDGEQVLVYGADGAKTIELSLADRGRGWVPDRFTRCGKWICALPIGGDITWWDDRGKIAGTVRASKLAGLDDSKVRALDLDGLGSMYLLVQTGDVGDRTKGAILRVDGF